MKEVSLRDFFLSRISAAELSRNLVGTEEIISPLMTEMHIEDMDGEFEVTPQMAIKVCDAVLAGELSSESLKSIGYALVASDHFIFDGETVLGEVLHDWAAPEINYPLTLENVQRFRRWLMAEEPYPARP
jgi:hypothetical protein